MAKVPESTDVSAALQSIMSTLQMQDSEGNRAANAKAQEAQIRASLDAQKAQMIQEGLTGAGRAIGEGIEARTERKERARLVEEQQKFQASQSELNRTAAKDMAEKERDFQEKSAQKNREYQAALQNYSMQAQYAFGQIEEHRNMTSAKILAQQEQLMGARDAFSRTGITMPRQLVDPNYDPTMSNLEPPELTPEEQLRYFDNAEIMLREEMLNSMQGHSQQSQKVIVKAQNLLSEIARTGKTPDFNETDWSLIDPQNSLTDSEKSHVYRMATDRFEDGTPGYYDFSYVKAVKDYMNGISLADQTGKMTQEDARKALKQATTRFLTMADSNSGQINSAVSGLTGFANPETDGDMAVSANTAISQARFEYLLNRVPLMDDEKGSPSLDKDPKKMMKALVEAAYRGDNELVGADNDVIHQTVAKLLDLPMSEVQSEVNKLPTVNRVILAKSFKEITEDMSRLFKPSDPTTDPATGKVVPGYGNFHDYLKDWAERDPNAMIGGRRVSELAKDKNKGVVQKMADRLNAEFIKTQKFLEKVLIDTDPNSKVFYHGKNKLEEMLVQEYSDDSETTLQRLTERMAGVSKLDWNNPDLTIYEQFLNGDVGLKTGSSSRPSQEQPRSNPRPTRSAPAGTEFWF